MHILPQELTVVFQGENKTPESKRHLGDVINPNTVRNLCFSIVQPFDIVNRACFKREAGPFSWVLNTYWFIVGLCEQCESAADKCARGSIFQLTHFSMFFV